MAALWLQVDPSLNRDDIDQWFRNVVTGNRVFGRTDGSFSDHIHLRFPSTGVNSGLNLDPQTGEVSKDGNVLGDLLALGILIAEAGVGGAFGVTGAAVATAKGILGPDGQPIDLAGLIFPPVA